MPVMFQKWIFRSDLLSNPNVLYLFGDNNERAGYGGQAKEMRDEPNAIGVRTKHAPTGNIEAFFSDHTYDRNMRWIEEDLAPAVKHLRNGGTLVIPADGLGTGLSALPQHAPITNEKLKRMLFDLAIVHPMPAVWKK